MAERRDPGTPIGGERPTRRRIFSPLHEMDGMDDGAEHLQNEVPVPLTPPHATSTQLTLESMSALLDRKFDERLQPLTDTVKEMQEDMQRVESNIDNVAARQDLMETHTRKDKQELASKIDDIEKRVAALELGQSSYSGDDREFNGYFTNMDPSASDREAIEWLEAKLTALGAPPEDVFYKGESYDGRLFVRFASPKSRDLALRKLRRDKAQHNGNLVRCRDDLPVEKRFVDSVLFGFKYLLCTEWQKYNKQQIKVEFNKNIVTVKGVKAIEIIFEDAAPCLHYEQGWKEWLQGSQWQEIVDGAQVRYVKAMEMASF